MPPTAGQLRLARANRIFATLGLASLLLAACNSPGVLPPGAQPGQQVVVAAGAEEAAVMGTAMAAPSLVPGVVAVEVEAKRARVVKAELPAEVRSESISGVPR